MKKKTFTVADYLIQRLHEIGIRHLFSIPGDYIVPFLQSVEDDGRIERIGNTNEMEAGYAADGCARMTGTGAVAVTCGVGAMSLVNTIAGAYVEKVPLVVINGTPGTDKRLLDRDTGLLWHHMMVGGESRDLQVYRNYTAAAVEVNNPARAALDIDQALSACLTEQLPVYLEMFEDIYAVPCAPPKGPLVRVPVASIALNVTSAAEAAAALIKKAGHPVIWGGVEVQRQGLQDAFDGFVARSGIPFTTSLEGKSIVSEANPLFAGVYDGQSSSPATAALVNNSDCLIALGAWPTDINLLGVTAAQEGGQRPFGVYEISALRNAVRVGTDYFPQVNLGDFIKALGKALKGYRCPAGALPASPPAAIAPAAGALSFDSFFQRMSSFVDESHTVVSDIGFSVLGAMNLRIAPRSGFVAQAVWSAIGYAVPAAIGVKCGQPQRRPVVFAGDGAFHMTVQAFATMVRLKQNAVIFVMNNGIYGVEQWLVNAAVFSPPQPSAVTEINELVRWEFSRLPEVFGGGKGYRVSTLKELDAALIQIRKAPQHLAIVDVRLPELSLPANALWKVPPPGGGKTKAPSIKPKRNSGK
jgi:indolepyruvate decarboxylase